MGGGPSWSPEGGAYGPFIDEPASSGDPAASGLTIEGTLSPGQRVAGRDSPVMLSAAQHLSAHRARSFAALSMTTGGTSQTFRSG